MASNLERANAIRALAMDAIQKANSGHPGAPLGMADMAEVLFVNNFRHNPANPNWINRDRFVLSNGHASALLYAVLYLTGYDLGLEDLKSFRQLGSRTPGHPERGLTPGVEMTTGPLGQGISSAVGMALAEAMLAHEFNRDDLKIIDHYTYVFCGDGCLMEGIAHEACSLAGTWKLDKLIVFYDANGISIDGNVKGWFNEDVAGRYKAYGWHVQTVNGHNVYELENSLRYAKGSSQPSLIICKTDIGFGSPLQGMAASHGAPLGNEGVQATRQKLGWEYPPFEIPEEILREWDAREKGAKWEGKWNNLWQAYKKAFPRLAQELARRLGDQLPEDWPRLRGSLKGQSLAAEKPLATRMESRNCLDELVPRMPELLGGSADLSSSVGTWTEFSKPLNVENYQGNYIFYGVREFAMGAIMNGLAIHGGFVPFGGTFLAFSDQAKNAIRLAALMSLRVIWVLTHDSIGVGEDGPTHQPIEQIPTLRLMPNLLVWRPADAEETAQAWISILESVARPACLILSRQALPQIERDARQVKDIARGGYILQDCEGEPELILIGTGSELHLVLEAGKILADKKRRCRVVSMPCTEVFDAQPAEWREKVLPPNVRKRMVVEAAAGAWWYRYTGLDGVVLGIDTFGLSAPGKTLFENFGFTVENIVAKAEQLLGAKENGKTE